MSVVDAVRPGAGAPDDGAASIRPGRSGHIRVYADAAGAAELMRELVGLRLSDAVLGEEGGHWYVDVQNDEGVLSQIVDLVATASEHGTIRYAMLCVDGRTFTFAPDGAKTPSVR